MSSAIFETMYEQHREWEPTLRRIVDTLNTLPPRSPVDPLRLAEALDLDPVRLIAMLHVLQEHGQGEYAVRVVDREGAEVKRYRTVAEVPDRVRNQFGELTRVYPENVEIVFQPSLR